MCHGVGYHSRQPTTNKQIEFIMKLPSIFHTSAESRLRAIAIMIVAATAVSCKHTPDGVLGQEDMAQLMADIHMGEAIIDFNYSTYPNDSTRKMLKQSIYASHNVTAEEVDTSFVWYGNHIEDYIKVYDRTIEIIQERQREAATAGNMQISVAGDSVQVWGGPQRIVVGSRMPSRIVNFSLTPDSTWKNGDIYTLSYKLVNSQAKVMTRLLVDYSNGSTVYVEEPETKQSKNVLKIQVDSTLTPLRIYGYMYFMPEKNISFEVDSMSLTRVRKDLMPNFYSHRKTFDYGIPNNGKTGSDDARKTEIGESAGTKSPHATRNGMQPRRVSETAIRRNSDDDAELPRPSSQSQRQSEHREDATLHKPTPAQRREAARQRSATTRQKSKATPQQAVPTQKRETMSPAKPMPVTK